MRLHTILVTASLLAFAGAGPSAAQIPRPVDAQTQSAATSPSNYYLPTEDEVRLGREVSAEIEREYKLVRFGPEYDRLQRVAREVLAASGLPRMIEEYGRLYPYERQNRKAKRVPFEFSVRLLDDDKTVNAVSLAGGPIYFTTGLLKETTSDDELAGVMAHELVHTTFHHVEQQMKRQQKVGARQIWTALAIIAASLAGGGQAASALIPVALGYQLVNIAALSGYSRELEAEADLAAVLLLTQTKYNPVGLLTFMQKLAREDRRAGNPDYGIFQTHPFSYERVEALSRRLQELGFKINSSVIRQASGRFRIHRRALQPGGKNVQELQIGGSRLLLIADRGEFDSVEKRAQHVAAQIEQLLESGASSSDVTVDPTGKILLIRGLPVYEALPGDLAGPDAANMVKDAVRTIHRMFLRERLDES